MSNPTDKNSDESEFSDDQFETQDVPEGEQSDAAEDTVDFDEFPAEPVAEETPDDGDSSESKISDDEFETLDLPEGATPDATEDTVEFEEFPAESAAEEVTAEPAAKADVVEDTVDLPDEKPSQEPQPTPTASEEQSISDTAVNEANEDPAEDNAATVIDPQLAESDEPPHDVDAQTVELNEQGEPSTAQTTYFDSDPAPPKRSILTDANTMQTVNTRDLSPQDAEELQRTIVDAQLASAASIADALDSDPPTDLRDSGTIPVDEPEGGSDNETQLVIQQRQLVEMTPGVATATADYELLELLGEGGMGVVYVANQTSIDRQVAIKMLKSKYVEKKQQRDNFLSEAVVTGDLDHPNIVPIYDLGKNESDALFYSMKRVKGTPWRDMLAKKSQKENIEILLQVADAVAFAHSRGVIHRDLKPENVMLGDYGEVLVMDWGLALTTSSFAAARSIAATTSMGCTPAYAAPELVRGPRGKIGPHSDVYLLGAILYQLVAGEPPHKGNNVLQCLAAATGNRITPTEKTGELIDIALKAMAAEPEDRHADVKSFQLAIREYLSHSESLTLADHATEDLQQAEQSSEYDDYARAVYGFREALEMWEGNTKAKDGLQRARLAYARCAQGKGDFVVGMQLLDTSNAEHAKLHTVLKAAKAEVDAREGRLKMARRIGVALAASILVIVSGASFWINSARQDAVTAQGVAEEQKGIAEDQKKIAVANEAEAVKQEGIAVEQRDRAVTAEKETATERDRAITAKQKEEIAKLDAENSAIEAREAEQAALEAKAKAEVAEKVALMAKKMEEEAKVKAVAAEKVAVNARKQEEVAKNNAITARDEAEEAKDAAVVAQQEQEYESYVASIGLAAERISANNFKDAINILQKLRSTSPELIDWEWHRLSYLTAPKQIPVNAPAMIDAVAFHPKANAFVAGGQNGTAFIWNASSPDDRVLLNQDANVDIGAVAYSRTGELVATAGSDGIISIWNMRTKPPTLERKLRGHTGRVTGVVFAPDQSGQSMSVKQRLPKNWLVSTSYDETAILWNVETGKPIHTFTRHTYHVRAAAFSPRGDLLVTVGDDSRAVVWSLLKGDDQFKQLTEFNGHFVTSRRDNYPLPVPIYAVAFSHDGKRVATGGDDNRVLIWNPLKVEKPQISKIAKSVTAKDQAKVNLEQELIEAFVHGQELELSGHGSAVHAVSFSSDDSQILSGSDDNTMKVWNARTGRLMKTLRGHAGWVRSCQFSPALGSQQVLSGSHDGQARIWNVDRYIENISLSVDESTDDRSPVIDHDDAVLAVAFDATTKYVVTAGRNQTARIWDAHTGELIGSLGQEEKTSDRANALQEGHAFLATTVIPFPNGKEILTSAMDNTTRIWDARLGTELVRLDDTGSTAAAAVSADGTLIATGSNVKKSKVVNDKASEQFVRRTYPIRLWETAAVKSATRTAPVPKMELDEHEGRVTAIAFSANGKYLLSGDEFGEVFLWRLADGKRIGRYVGPLPEVRINSVLFYAEDNKILAASDDSNVYVWSCKTEKEAQGRPITFKTVLKHGDSVTTMALVPTEQPQLLTATGGKEKLVRLWNLDTGLEEKKFNDLRGRNGNALITGLSVSPNGDRAFAANWDDQIIHVIDIESKTVIGSSSNFGAVWSTAVFRTGGGGGMFKLATIGVDNARVWNLPAVGELEEVSLETTLAPHESVTAAAFSADGRFVVTGGGNNALKMWNVADRTSVESLPTVDAKGKPYHTKGITFVSFSQAGASNWLLTASGDGAVILWNWNPAAGKATVERIISEFDPEQTVGVNCAVFSRDARMVLTTSDDGTAHIWETATGKQIGSTLKGHKGPVLCGVFAPDGKWVVTGGADDTARIWETATGKQIKRELIGHTDDITSVDVSPRGTRILTGSLDKTAKLWDPRIDSEQPDADEKADAPAPKKGAENEVKEAREILTLGGRSDGHQGGITSVSFSADGLNGPIVTGSLDGTAILWLADQAAAVAQKKAAQQDEERKVAGN
jgi:WD40 repeat protein/serine/threonine protein kinase